MATINEVMEAFFNLTALVPDGMDEVESFSFEGCSIDVEFTSIEDKEELEDELDALGADEDEIAETIAGFDEEDYVNKFEYTVSVDGFEDELSFSQLYAPGDRVEINGAYYDEEEVDGDVVLKLFSSLVENDAEPSVTTK